MSSPKYGVLDTTKDEIRLITVLAGQFDQPLQCTLDHYSLISAPAYTGLSYCWESDIKNSAIVVNQENVLITESLRSALRHIRKADMDVVVWADALCINQDDPIERASQVSIMDKIYKKASQVWIWLGERSHDSDLAMELVKSIDDEHLSDPTYNADPARWAAATSLHQRPWWMRIWVVQEALLARTASIHCGLTSATIEQFAHFHCVADKYGSRYSTAARLQAVRSFGTDSPFLHYFLEWEESKQLAAKGGLTFLGLLAYTGRALCKDPRDKIYALLGLCDDFTRQGITVDYTITVRELFVHVTAHLLSRKWLSSPYSVLQTNQEDKCLDLPSWVPDFTTEDKESHLIYQIYNPVEPLSSTPYRAAGSNAAWHRLGVTYGVPDAIDLNSLPLNTAIPRISPDGSGETLSTIGLKVDVVSYASETPVVPYYQGLDMAEDVRSRLERRERTITKANEWWMYVQSLSPLSNPYSALCDREEAFWRTIITNNDFDLLGPPDGEDFRGRFRAWIQCKDSSNDPAEDYWRPYNNPAVWCCIKRSFFVTERGYMGLGPSRTRAGDFVCILKGALVPFVLRTAQDDCFTFLGEAYVHGIMDGEFLPKACTGDVRTFNLR